MTKLEKWLVEPKTYLRISFNILVDGAMRGQTFFTDIVYVIVYYIVLAKTWGVLFNQMLAPGLAGTDWEWVLPVIEIVAVLSPILFLIYKMNFITLFIRGEG